MTFATDDVAVHDCNVVAVAGSRQLREAEIEQLSRHDNNGTTHQCEGTVVKCRATICRTTVRARSGPTSMKAPCSGPA
jgi:hypothetical protein